MSGNIARYFTQVIILLVIAAASTGYIYFAYYANGEQKVVSGTETRKVEKAPAPVVIATVELGDVTREILLVGTIDAEYRLQVIPEAAGKLLSIDVTEGSAVKEGDTVAEIEHAFIDKQVEQAQVGLEMAEISMRKTVLDAQRAQANAGLEAALAGQSQVRTNKANLEKERNRVKKLHADGLVSESTLDSIETSLTSLTDQEALVGAQVSQARAVIALLDAQLEDIATARRKQAASALDLALLQKDKATVKAPRAGIVNRKFVEVGDMVGPSRPLFEIIGMDSVKLAVDLPETMFGRIEAGKTKAMISVDAWPDKAPFEGVISRFGPSLNPASRSIPAEVRVANPGHLLRPGMSARVTVMPEFQANVVRVPIEAVVGTGSDKHVFVLTQDKKKVVKTPIETGLSSDKQTEVLKGLNAGDRVVVRGNVGLSDGSAVLLLEGK